MKDCFKDHWGAGRYKKCSLSLGIRKECGSGWSDYSVADIWTKFCNIGIIGISKNYSFIGGAKEL